MHISHAVALALPLIAAAQAPTAYSVTQVNSMFGPGVTQKIYRDGSKALIDNQAPGQNGAAGSHVRTLYDLAAGKSITWDVANPSTPCSSGAFKGDWGDPFAAGEAMKADIMKSGPKETGAETIGGISAKIYEGTDGGTAFKVWIDPKSGLLIRVDLVSSGAAQTIMEIKEASFARPSASVFAVPPSCTEALNAPPAPTDGERFAKETGGQPGDFLNANMAPSSASSASCTLLLRPVAAGTMQPLTGYKVKIDDSDKTAQVRNGVLRIDNAPEHFNVSLDFGNAGGAFAMIYRQCPKPQTVLLMVAKDPSAMGKGVDWMLVQSGKFAQ